MDDTHTDSKRPIYSNESFSREQFSYHLSYAETPSSCNNSAREEHPAANQAPSSLFAQTVQEFYAFFPAAKQASAEYWGYQQASFEGTGLQYGEKNSSHFVEPQCPPPQYPVQPEHSIQPPHLYTTSVNAPQVIDDCSMTPPLPKSSFNYVFLVQSATLSPDESSTQCKWTESEVHTEPYRVLRPVGDIQIQEELSPTAPSPCILAVEDRFLVPSQHPQLERSTSQPRRRGGSPSPNFKFITSSSSDFISTSPSNSAFSVQLTGNWPTDAQALSEASLHVPTANVIFSHKPVIETPSTQQYTLKYRPRRSRLHLHGKGSSSPSSRARMRSPKHRTGEAKKPLLACFFCRGRKIACGSPMYGDAEETCDQCEKRNLMCKYPTESRRGIRKGIDEKNLVLFAST